MATEPPTRGGRGARARILQAANALFRERAINATGVAELAAAAHVSKRTLYQHFPTKDEVVLAYLRECADEIVLGAHSVLTRGDLSARARLLELFVPAEPGPGGRRGSPFVNAAVEIPDPRHPVHRFAAEHQDRFTQRLADLAREAGASDPERVGRQFALLYDGAAAQAVVSDSDAPAALAYTMAAAILDRAIG
jgi:AcrR family transcriptional regulator